MLNVTTETIFEVAEVSNDSMSSGIRADRLDRLIKKIHEERECQELVSQVNVLRVKVKEDRDVLQPV